ncbi:MAG: hypothetical protein M1132_05940 [Chloroflexi bacterium]|nr:hypothetical protein [Chloroflexota bacterium]
MLKTLERFAVALPIFLAATVALAACGGTPAPTVAPTRAPTTAPTGGPTTAPTAVPTPAPTSAPTPTPTEVMVLQVSQNPKLGTLLTNARGMTLYVYGKDKPDTSNCTGDCVKNWLPLTVPTGVTPTAGKGIVGNIGLIAGGNGADQVTYNDMPLYVYAGDAKPGETNGNGQLGLWSVVVMPPATSVTPPPATSATDWTTHGYSKTLATQAITPGTATTIKAGPYTIFVPADAFTAPVEFDVLSGDPATFQAQAPQGQTPVLAFAFNVRDAKTKALIAQFNKPVMLTASDGKIAGDSGYYNVDASGGYILNLTGIQVQAGELTHPIAGASVGWVITAPTVSATGSAGK